MDRRHNVQVNQIKLVLQVSFAGEIAANTDTRVESLGTLGLKHDFDAVVLLMLENFVAVRCLL